MSSPDESSPKTDTKPLLDAARRPAEEGGTPSGHRTAGQAALEQALSQAGKDLEDLTGETAGGGTGGARG
ncbi:hypothetical protein ABZ815_25725 [Nonomuraea sp. NPDC047529]|uniref:hypothetical protein n=1 Tax=Nonomuraea sp. NPDC047529 TaxID=3155623 RepID=UPI003408FC84